LSLYKNPTLQQFNEMDYQEILKNVEAIAKSDTNLIANYGNKFLPNENT